LSEKVGSVSVELQEVGNAGLILYIGYSMNVEGKDQYVFEAITLESTRLCSEGQRWWFKCPRLQDGKPCRKRVAKLYLPPDGVYFGCCQCYDLTYMSSQNPEARIAMPEQVRRFLSGLGNRILIQKNQLRG